MKKIYMILAAMSLLSMSLNAQLLPQYQARTAMPEGKRAPSHVMEPGSMLRMPTLNEGEYLLGPYTTDDFSTSGLGFPSAYDQEQKIRILTVLPRAEFSEHLGDSIIGFRFALAGNTSQKVRVHNFYSLPYSANGWNDLAPFTHVWPIKGLAHEAEGGTAPVTVTSTVTFTAGTNTSTSTSPATITQDGVTITNTQSTTNNACFNFNPYRLYAGTVTVSAPTGSTITSIVFNGTDGTRPVSRLSVQNNNGSYSTSSDNVGTWTGDAATVTFNASNQLRCSSIVVTLSTTRSSNTLRAAAAGTVDVGNGASTSSYLPVRGYYQDYGYTNQMIYNTHQLGLTEGSQITSITFYPNSGYGINFYGSTVTMSVGNTTTSSFSGSQLTPDDLTSVASKRITAADASVTAWTFTFDQPFTYTGGNLLVQMSCPGYYEDNTNGQFATSSFLGDNQTTTVSNYSGTNSAFLPKATFGYYGETTEDYVELSAGQWHDFYLDRPVEFNVSGDSIDKLEIGYDYTQYPAGTTGQLLYPIAYNPNSQTHDHYSFMYGSTSTSTYTYSDVTITTSNYYVEFSDITVYDADNNVLTSWNANSTDVSYYSSGGYYYYNLPDNWTLTDANYFVQGGSGTDDDPYAGYLSRNGSAYITIPGSLLSSSSVRVVCTARNNGGTGTLAINNGTQTTPTTTFAPYELTINGTASTTTSYTSEQQWYHLNTLSTQYGDLAVQLILKPGLEKTPAPTITYNWDNGYYYITATATDPTATVTLTVGGQTASGTGSVTIPVGRGSTDQTVEASATAQEPGKAVSDKTTETITIEATHLEPTPDPTISVTPGDLSYQVTGAGEGEVHMYIDGQEVTRPYYLERGTDEYTVTVTVTAQITDGDHAMATTTQQVVIPPLGNIDLTGWTEMPATYANDEVINWDNNLMFVDRFTASTAQNDHPAKYIYHMTEDSTKLDGNPRSTNEHIVPVQLTRSKVNGFFTEDQVLDDTDRKHVDIRVMNADVEMYLEHSSDIYYYTLDRSKNNTDNDEYYLALSNLQNDNTKYVEMNDYFLPKYAPFEYGTANRYDTINAALPANIEQGINGRHFGKYGESFMSYVPIIWTLGNLPTNKRANWDNDHKHNSYGSPIWKTGVGKVELVGKPTLERQDGANGSANWLEINGSDTTACSLYMITDITALGYLPSPEVSNIKYEPYMFRVWVESPSGKLRNYIRIPADTTNHEKPGEHYEGNGVIPANTPYMVWEEAIADSTENITFTSADMTTFHKEKIEGTDTTNHWIVPEALNMIFAATNDLSANDLKIYVRFYYKSTGNALNAEPNLTMTFMLPNREPAKSFYGVEGQGDPDPEIPTCIKGVYTDAGNAAAIENVTYYNLQGMKSDKPFEGINIVVTRYSNGTMSSKKILR